MARSLVVWMAVLSLTGGCSRKDARVAAVDKPETQEFAASTPDFVRVGGVAGGLQSAGAPPPPPADAPLPVPQERRLIRQGRATLEVVSVDAALDRLRDLTRQAGGYTTSETRSRDRQRVNHGDMECRIPAGKLDSMTAVLKSLGTVESLTLSASDITEEYFDLEIRLRNGHALETRLLALLERPGNKLSDLLDAERELARLRGEIERMEGRRRFWDNRVALSSLSVAVHEPVPTVGGDQGGTLSVLRGAFADSANNFVSAIAGVIAVTGGLLPIAAALVLAGWILARGWRWRRARRAARQPAANAAR